MHRRPSSRQAYSTVVGSSQRAVRLLAALVRGGLREVVLSPGSRSAPLALALYAADVAGDLRLHVRVDERSAGFLALGLAIGSRAPVAVVTTSGTAVGNLLPAVMEASHSGRRLVVITADRPARLRGTGANQTTRQDGIFGRFAPCFDLPADAAEADLDEAAGVACRRQGPTHVNLQLDEPLVPSGPPQTWWPAGLPHLDPPEAPEHETDRHQGRRPGVEVLKRGPRTVVVAGDDSGSAARILAERAGWPLLAEPTSGARVGANAIRSYRLLLRGALASQVERVLVLGHPTLSRPITALVSRTDIEVLAAPGPGGLVTDPGRVARHLGHVPTVSQAAPTPADLDWLDTWREADAKLSERLDAFVDSLPELDALHVAREMAAAVGPYATLVAGSSNAVRDLDLMAVPYAPHEHRFVVGNRGLAGIDGTVSTAIGVALGRRDASRTLALVGDVTFLHDANGLILGPDEPSPDLTIVVVNDDGGSIFATLEQGELEKAGDAYASAFERVFGTPHHADLEALCRASNTEYRQVNSVASLRAVLAVEPRGIQIVEAPVSRGNRRASADAIAGLVED